MSDTATIIEPEVKQPEVAANPFAAGSWNEQVVQDKVPEEAPAPVIVPSDAPPIVEKKEEHTIIDPNEWLKQELGYETVDAAKKEIEELRKLREAAQTPAEIKFANEQSQRFFEAVKDGKEDEVYGFLHKKRELSTLENLKSDEAIRLNIKYSNPHFKNADIQDVFDEQYSKPTKPVLGVDEEESDYNVRVQQWQSQVEKIDRKIERDAYAAKSQLAKYNTELVLPDIPKKESPIVEPQIDAEALAKFTTYKGEVHQKLDTVINGFSGYNVTYKDEAVEIPIAYSISAEEKPALLQFVKNEILGESFNVNDFFGKRWFDDQGNPKQELLDDAYHFQNREKVIQKMVNEAANKRLLEYKKEIKNTNVTGSPQGTFNPSAPKEDFDSLAAQVWRKQS